MFFYETQHGGWYNTLFSFSRNVKNVWKQRLFTCSLIVSFCVSGHKDSRSCGTLWHRAIVRGGAANTSQCECNIVLIEFTNPCNISAQNNNTCSCNLIWICTSVGNQFTNTFPVYSLNELQTVTKECADVIEKYFTPLLAIAFSILKYLSLF